MVAHYSAGATAERGAVARYLLLMSGGRQARRLVELRDRWLNPPDWVNEQIALKSLPEWEVSVHGTPDQLTLARVCPSP